MAMQAGLGVSRILIIFGAGYTSTILLKHGKLSDVIGELQKFVRGFEPSAESNSNPLSDEVNALSQLIDQMKPHQGTVIYAGSGQNGLSALIIPLGVLGTIGYGYMWWKGLSFSDIMYVSKRSMANAVSNLSKHLETVSETLAKTKRHLIQRIENLDGKVDDVREMAKLIKDDVSNVRGDLSRIDDGLFDLKNSVDSLDERIGSLALKQDLTLEGVDYLCRIVDGKRTLEGLDYLCRIVDGKRRPQYLQFLQDQCRDSTKSLGQLTSTEALFSQGLKGVADIFTITDGNVQDGLSATTNQHRSLRRIPPIKTVG